MNSVIIKVKDRSGKIHEQETPTDMNLNLMEVCKANDLPVKGTCGGIAACASCHVYIQSEKIKLSAPSEEEENMLDSTFFVKSNSRLGCQIYITEEMNGLEVELAPEDESENNS